MGQDAASTSPMKIPQQHGRNMKWIVLLKPNSQTYFLTRKNN